MTSTAVDQPTAPDQASFRRLQRRTVRVLGLAQVIGAIGLGVTPSVGVLLAEQVTDSDVWAGLARTGSTLGAAISGLPLAYLAVRRGRRWALSIGWLLSAVGAATLVAAAQWQNLTALVLGLLIAGVGTAAQLQARFAATDLASPLHKAKALSTVVWVGALGSVLGPNLGGPGAWLAHRAHLDELGGAFVFAAAALLLAGVTTAVLLRPDPLLTAVGRQSQAAGAAVSVGEADPPVDQSHRPTAQTGTPRPSRLAMVHEVAALCRANGTAALALTAIVTAQVLMVAVMTMAPVHIAGEGGSLTLVGVSISLHVLGMYGLAPVAGAVADRFGASSGIALGAVLFAASFVLVILDPASMTIVTVSLVLLGLGWSFMGVAGAASLSTTVGEDQRARIQGFADTSSNLAAALAAFLGGPIMAALGYDGLAAVAAIAMAPACVLLILRHRAAGPATAGG